VFGARGLGVSATLDTQALALGVTAIGANVVDVVFPDLAREMVTAMIVSAAAIEVLDGAAGGWVL
jgi:hypothetical protein